MAKMTRARAELIEAIRAMGIEPNDTRKIIIEIDDKAPVRMHVQQYASTALLGVVKAVTGDIEVRSSDSRCGSLGDEDERVCARERRHDGRHGCIPADGVVAWW